MTINLIKNYFCESGHRFVILLNFKLSKSSEFEPLPSKYSPISVIRHEIRRIIFCAQSKLNICKHLRLFRKAIQIFADFTDQIREWNLCQFAPVFFFFNDN